jgi:UDP-glucose 4-epimerase
MKKNTILVTGGTGYIGSHTSVELIEAGYEVIIADNLSNSNEDVLDGIERITGVKPKFYRADCTDKEGLGKIFKENAIDAVIHFAASKAVGESVKQPLQYYHNNLGGLMTLIELMMENNVKHVVFSSSCTVYGQPEVLPATEDSPRLEATSPYGNTKRICEDILRDSINAYGKFEGIALRYFNPIGAHPTALIGELPNGVPNNLIPYVTQTAAGKLKCLTVFGDDYDTPDGSCIRDYIDVVDLSKAHVCAMKYMLEGKMKHPYDTFNIGTGRGVSTLEIIRTFQEVNGVKLNWQIGKRREGDIEAIWGNPAKANRELGWKAERPLSETLKAAWAWQKHLAEIGK